MVREINYSPGGVTVKTEDNSVYRADYVMVSASLGVLQSALIQFKPQLPVSSSYHNYIFPSNHCKNIHIFYQQFPFCRRHGRLRRSTNSTWPCTQRYSSSSPRSSGLKGKGESSSSTRAAGEVTMVSGRYMKHRSMLLLY